MGYKKPWVAKMTHMDFLYFVSIIIVVVVIIIILPPNTMVYQNHGLIDSQW
jgi:hypothetical protein